MESLSIGRGTVPLAEDECYRVVYVITPPEAWENEMVEDKRALHTRLAIPVVWEKLNEKFAPLRVDIIHYERTRWL